MNEMDEYAETQRINNAAVEIVAETGIEIDAESLANDLLDWAMDSQSRSGIVYQIAAAQEFGATLSEYTKSQAQMMGINIDADFSDERAVLRYFNSKQHYGMTLYRGSDHEESNALESWTTDRDIAEFYVERNGGGMVIERYFEAIQIVGTWKDGLGLECAREVVVHN